MSTVSPVSAQFSDTPFVALHAVCKSFGGPNVLDDISFVLKHRQVHSIIGPNGAGKTTLMNIISGLYRPTSGRVLLDGADIAGRKPSDLPSMGLSRTFQNLKVSGSMTVLENVMLGRHRLLKNGFVRGLVGGPDARRAEMGARRVASELLDFVGLNSDGERMPGELSYGALKRVEIARALASEPSLLLLDEPAAGLNPQETGEIKALIQALAGRGITVILVEHDMKLVMEVSDNVVVINYGRKIAEGPPEQVARNPDVITAYLGTRGH